MSVLAVLTIVPLAVPQLTAGGVSEAPQPGIKTSRDGVAFRWLGPGGQILPFSDWQEVEDFLSTARVIRVKAIPTGINRPLRMELERDGIRMKAIYRSVEVFKHRWEGQQSVRINFHDSCRYELAAYRLSRLLQLDHVPPVVERHFTTEDFSDRGMYGKLERKSGTLQAWVENAMTENERREKKLSPPSPREWSRQHQLMKIFDALIFNDDRNQGNILIGPDWKIWFIDATRAFRPFSELLDPDDIRGCDPEVWVRLQALKAEEIRRDLDGVLTPSLIDRVIDRLEALKERLRNVIEMRSERAALR